MSDDKVFITAEQAISILAGDEQVHTFRQGGPTLIGADWSRESIESAIRKFESSLELTGEQARAMKHGMALEDDCGYLFIETDEEKLVQLETELQINNH